MTPISSISGVPHLQTVFGVQLEPEGTHFFQPLTLVMHPPRAVPLKQQLAFSAQGDGGNFHLYPSDATVSTVTLQLDHFSVDLTGFLKTGTSQVGPNTVTTWVGIPGTVKGDDAARPGWLGSGGGAETDSDRGDQARPCTWSIDRTIAGKKALPAPLRFGRGPYPGVRPLRHLAR